MIRIHFSKNKFAQVNIFKSICQSFLKHESKESRPDPQYMGIFTVKISLNSPPGIIQSRVIKILIHYTVPQDG
jgi:hypothetical protein